jgi:hypothetical protein
MPREARLAARSTEKAVKPDWGRLVLANKAFPRNANRASPAPHPVGYRTSFLS